MKKYTLTFSSRSDLPIFDETREADTPEEVGAILRQITWDECYVTEVRITIDRPVRLCGTCGGGQLTLPGQEPDPLERP